MINGAFFLIYAIIKDYITGRLDYNLNKTEFFMRFFKFQ